MANRINLTDRAVAALRPAEPGKRQKIADAVVPGLVVRVTDKGGKTFILWKRWNGAAHPSAKALGTYPAMSLAEAREKAREWLGQLERGVDPRAEEERRRAEEHARKALEQALRANKFSAVAEDYIARHLSGKRTGQRAAREIRSELVPHWGERSISDITKRDVVQLIEAIVDRPAPYLARNIYVHVQGLFGWAIHRGIYGVEHSPTDRLRPSQLVGALPPRQRVLTDDELHALWRAAGKLGYPFGPLIRMLMLTGARLNEVAGARWREFDTGRRRWIVPPERFKSNAQHLVPLTEAMVALLAELPRWKGGEHLFSTTDGAKPVNGFSKSKERLDKLIVAELGGPPAPWVVHDIRRTVRTRLSELRVSHEVAEMIIGHGRKGLARVYDQHGYADEMRAALEAWNARLGIIIKTPPAVVELRKAGAL